MIFPEALNPKVEMENHSCRSKSSLRFVKQKNQWLLPGNNYMKSMGMMHVMKD